MNVSLSIEAMFSVMKQLNNYQRQLESDLPICRDALLSIVMNGLVEIEGVDFCKAVELVCHICQQGEDECWEAMSHKNQLANLSQHKGTPEVK